MKDTDGLVLKLIKVALEDMEEVVLKLVKVALEDTEEVVIKLITVAMEDSEVVFMAMVVTKEDRDMAMVQGGSVGVELENISPSNLLCSSRHTICCRAPQGDCELVLCDNISGQNFSRHPRDAQLQTVKPSAAEYPPGELSNHLIDQVVVDFK
jgi:hypothetical protein